MPGSLGAFTTVVYQFELDPRGWGTLPGSSEESDSASAAAVKDNPLRPTTEPGSRDDRSRNR